MTTPLPTPADVGQYYDTLGPFYQVLWGDSIHFGFWADPTDATVTMAQAQHAFTDLMIDTLALPPDQRVLDVGCGTGRPAIQLATRTGAQVTGITVSQTQQATATGYAQASPVADQVQFALVDAMQLPYADASFDAAWAFESIFHMPSRVQVFREMGRVVRPGGRIVVADFVTLRPMTPEEIAIAYPAFAVNEIGSLDAYIGDLKQVGLTTVTCRDVTVNTIRPSNRATLGAMQTTDSQAQLRATYGDAMVDGFLGGWEAIKTVNETLAYVVLTAERP